MLQDLHHDLPEICNRETQFKRTIFEKLCLLFFMPNLPFYPSYLLWREPEAALSGLRKSPYLSFYASKKDRIHEYFRTVFVKLLMLLSQGLTIRSAILKISFARLSRKFK